MSPTLLFLIFLALIAVALYAVWRYWGTLARVTPEEEEFDERVAALNERQANRLSDEQLTRPMSDDDAWNIMVRRGQSARERGRTPGRAPTRSLLPPRRERYGGDLLRRIGERRDRQAEVRRIEGPRTPPDRADEQ